MLVFSCKRAFACGAALSALLINVAAWAQQQTFDVAGQSATQAVPEFARQAGIQIVAPGGRLRDVRTNPVKGQFEVRDALRQLLAGTGLTFRDSNGAIVIEPAAGSSVSPKQAGAELTPRNQAAPNAEEIIVTATKRPEAARAIAGSVSVATAAQLDAAGAQSFADYLTRTPGVTFNAGIPGLSSVTVRGVANGLGQGQGTTGLFINDVPLTDPFYTVAVPDIDTFDVDNVAVLRGPQGTLFGSASLGGAVNYQAAKPNLREVQGRVQATLSGTEHGGTGGGAKAMFNVPIVEDKLAIRGVYLFRQDAGYVDNLGTGRSDSNVTRTRGGRFQVAFMPTDTTRINYLFLQQTQTTDDTGQTQTALGELRKQTAFPEFYKFRTTIHNLRLDQDLGFATLIATATYHSKKQASDIDVTSSLGRTVFGAQSPALHAPQLAVGKGSTFEVRLVSPTGQKFEYLVGFMRDDTRVHFEDTIRADGAAQRIEARYAPTFGRGIGQTAPNDVFDDVQLGFRGRETALFGEASYRFDEQWKLTLGGRAFDTRSDNGSDSSGFLELLFTDALASSFKGSQSERGFTPKASLTWTPTQDFMAYALISKGFRFGGPNIFPPDPALPAPNFKSDSLYNYELGLRANFFDRKVQFDLTGYYVDWSNIQLAVNSPNTGFAYTVNGGAARSYGVEAVTSWRPTADLTLQSSLTYLSAQLQESFNPGLGKVIPAGTTLPGASKWSIANSVSYQVSSLAGAPTLLASHRYLSHAPGSVGQWDVTRGGYNLLDLRLSVRVGAVDVSGFLTNVTDERGVTTAQHTSASQPYKAYIVQPRTAGITFDYRF